MAFVGGYILATSSICIGALQDDLNLSCKEGILWVVKQRYRCLEVIFLRSFNVVTFVLALVSLHMYLPELSEVGSVAVSYTLVHCLTAKTSKVHGRHCRASTLVAVGGTTLILTSFITSAISFFFWRFARIQCCGGLPGTK